MRQVQSLVFGEVRGGSLIQECVSPVNGKGIAELSLLSEADLKEVFEKAKRMEGIIKKDFGELIKLAEYFEKNKDKFTEQIIWDAGFTQKDSEDLVEGCVEFCRFYSEHIKQISAPELKTTFSFRHGAKKITLSSNPYGLVAVTTPRNTPLITELTVIVHALWSGNVLVLRPSPGVAGIVGMLIEGLNLCFEKETLKRTNIVFADAKDFVRLCLSYANLLHYVGSTKYLENTLISGIKSGVKVLLDGDGCSVVVIDKTVDIKEAIKICYEGLVRCNGEICITIRAIVVEKSIYEQFKVGYMELIDRTTVGVPGMGEQVGLGPLFSAAQVENILEVAKKYKKLGSQADQSKRGANYMVPIVLELDPKDSSFLRESLFGPMVGISYFEDDGWRRWLTENPINLTDAVLSKDESFVSEFLLASKSPRRVVNQDPTIESVFEPWGAFLPSGWNDVSHWFYKYRNCFQLVRE